MVPDAGALLAFPAEGFVVVLVEDLIELGEYFDNVSIRIGVKTNRLCPGPWRPMPQRERTPFFHTTSAESLMALMSATSYAV